ncbi:DNA replication/repair protein RecF [Ligilactobacillus sp. WILCCON 0076]|uniref:DNA replication and repair protein RecF n=1 Tax=Ligilactobacillus ubinensis TaxID=2876789 RepID=A0A9X2FLU0_9LACO|nr:DNA replication/repair protein RecF [Ligilactobacillus ubinensis]MCP0887076.1 DNA replication/repair protein RecF [Ligilactobacillus ubinensis]
MYLKELQLKNFRNYNEANITFSPAVNVLIGENAQGKTNLLEAIYVLAMASSHRTAKDKELIGFNQQYAQLKGEIIRRLGPLTLELELSKKGKKVKVNHIERAKLSEYIGQLNVILFAPEDLALVKGAPAERRRFIDMEFSQIDGLYLHDLSQYRTVLRQRNKYLKDLQLQKTKDQLYLDVLSEQLASLGGKIIVKRLEYLQELESYARILHAEITQKKETLTLSYEAPLRDATTKTAMQLSNELLQKMNDIRKKEIFQGTTLIGPHRDDIKFFINDNNVQIYGSQGQQRTAALSIKLAEIEVMKEQTGEYPILLLDDVLSELDGNRQTHLLKTIQDKVQTFLTTPGLNDIARQLIKEPKIFNIHAGEINLKL